VISCAPEPYGFAVKNTPGAFVGTVPPGANRLVSGLSSGAGSRVAGGGNDCTAEWPFVTFGKVQR
jgi:hypothetical protein